MHRNAQAYFYQDRGTLDLKVGTVIREFHYSDRVDWEIT